METYQLTENEYNKLLNEDTSLKDFKILQEKANNRFEYIVAILDYYTGRKRNWFDFGNEAGENAHGYFDPEIYSKKIYLTGKFEDYYKTTDFTKYDDFIPTSWLKDSFEQSLSEEINEHLKNQENIQIAQKNQKKINDDKFATLYQNIFAKLNDEEKNFLSSNNFTKFQEEYRKSLNKQAKEEAKAQREIFKNKTKEEKAEYYRKINCK